MTVPKSGLSLNCIRQLLPGAITNNSFEAIPGEACRIHAEDHVHKVPQANTAEFQFSKEDQRHAMSRSLAV